MHDFADNLRNLGYEVEVYNPPNINRGELRNLKIAELEARNIPITEKAIDELRLPDDVITKTQSYRNQVEWAKKIRDEGWNVIDLGNNTGDPSLGPYYKAETDIFFPQ